jgi:hypothetical protein
MIKKEKRKIAVGILPWVGLHEDVHIGPVVFWPWVPTRIEDVEIRKQLERFFKIFIDQQGKVVNTIAVCSHKQTDFHELEATEYKDLVTAINVFVFSSVCPVVHRAVCSNNNSIAPPSAEQFDFFGQKFKIPDDNIVVISTRNAMLTNSLNEVHVSRPWGVNTWPVRPNKELLNAFNMVFDNSFDSDVRERIFRSLEWFKFAHTDGNNVSDASRLVMMATAFEILLDFPDGYKSIYFAEQIEKYLKKKKSINETRIYKNKPYTRTKAAWWAFDFYQLRNKIVHGEQFNPEDGRYKDWVTFNIVSDLVFWELIVNELYEYECLGEKIRAWAQKYKHVESVEKTLLDSVMGFNEYHRSLGWAESLKRKEDHEIV